MRKIFTYKRIILIAGCFANTLFMLWLTAFWMNLPQSLPDEYLLVQGSSVTKNIILGLEKKPDTTRFLFVNVAWDKVMVGKPDPDVPEMMIGVEPITDRQKLAQFLELLAYRNDFKFLVYDINFKGTTEHDSILTARINAIPNMLVSYHRDENDKPDYPDLKIKKSNLGLSDIEKVYDQSFKFKLCHDTMHTTPLKMYEKIYKKKFEKGDWFYSLCGQPIFNSFILDYRIRNFDYTSGKYPRVHLGEFLNLFVDSTGAINPASNEEYLKLLKNRIIVVGDFEDRDIHQTIYGNMPGPIILLDVFLAIEAGDNRVTIWFGVFLFFAYILVNLATFGSKHIYPKWLQKLFAKKTEDESFLEAMTVYLVLFSAISVACFFMFNIHIGVLVLAFYMNLLENIKARIIKRNEKRALKLATMRASNAPAQELPLALPPEASVVPESSSINLSKEE